MKKVYLKQRDIQLLAGAFCVCLILNVIIGFLPSLFAATTIPLNLLVFAFAIGYLVRRDEAYRIYERDPAANYNQLESLLKLFQVLDFKAPLPKFRSWAASPDCCVELVRLVMEKKCQTIVECGSGISTLVHAKTLQQLGSGHVYSLDHDAFYADKTRQMLSLHGLEDFATVITAPLEKTEIDGKSFEWYSASGVNNIPDGIDLLFVDGPPAKSPDTRFPALPLLQDKLSEGATVVMDDYIRDGEKQVVKDWTAKYKRFDFTKTELETEKGTCILESESSSS